ncbi:4Fe-4S binding protein [Desulfosediminicola ganghwensis]|uniref:4Fe-4S binding protein n=1 Tax=Desulfosediminicola ganghwensis TaxID=2569540 RepID=UPI0010AD1C87|nr:4Fe-4S binding protein [Desulfosediminicola ganghwensis]
MGRTLQLVRRIFAGSFFLLLLLYVGGTFSEIYGFDPSLLSRIQFIPALMAGSFAIVIAITLFTVIFGRWYCSFLCPLGILHDILARFQKKKVKNTSQGPAIVRYSILTVCVISIFSGASLALLLVDPWSLFGRLTTTFAVPPLTFANNQLSVVLNQFGIYSVVAKDYHFAGISVLLVAVLSLSLICYFLYAYGPRFWCNTICPVGTVLSLAAIKPLVRVTINDERCVSCGLCEQHCKAGVITLQTEQVDSSNCVCCFNCLPVCNYEAISYNSPIKRKSV